MSLKPLFLVLVVLLLMCLLTYLYLTLSEFCVDVELWCPSPHHTFKTKACCSSLWLSLGAPLGMGNECHFEMKDLEEGCPMYDCYKNYTNGEWNTNGCSYVPNQMLTQGACDIHDLCYITPFSTKVDCDSTFLENIEMIYCDNVNLIERIACSGKAKLSVAIVAGIDQFFDASSEMRDSCVRTRSGSDWMQMFILILIIIISTLIILNSRFRRNSARHHHHQPRDDQSHHPSAIDDQKEETEDDSSEPVDNNSETGDNNSHVIE